jgi:hypothetical protein
MEKTLKQAGNLRFTPVDETLGGRCASSPTGAIALAYAQIASSRPSDFCL